MMPLFIQQFRSFAEEINLHLECDDIAFSKERGVWTSSAYYRTIQKCSKMTSSHFFTYRNGHLPEGYFSLSMNKNEKIIPFSFKMIEGLKPAQALGSIGKEWSLLDSRSAYMVVFYRALFQLLGEEKFNNLYKDSFVICRSDSDEITKLFFETVPIQNAMEAQPGDECWFNHLHFYTFKHQLTHEFSAMRTDDPDHPFLVLGLKKEGCTQIEVEEALRHEYNLSPLFPEKWLKNDQITRKEFLEIQQNPPLRMDGRLVLSVRRPRFDRIEQMMNTPLNGLTGLIEKWKGLAIEQSKRPVKRLKEDSSPRIPFFKRST